MKKAPKIINGIRKKHKGLLYVFKLGARISEKELLARSEEHTSELQSLVNLVCRLLLEKKKEKETKNPATWRGLIRPNICTP